MAIAVNQKLRKTAKQAWWRISIRPRSTMRALLVVRVRRPIILIGALMGVAVLANAPLLYPRGSETAGRVLAWIAVVGPALGWALLWVGGWLVWKCGRIFFRGRGSWREVQFGLAWGATPMMYSLFLWVPFIMLQWGPWFWDALNRMRLVFAVFVIWSMVVTVQTVGEAHGLKLTQALTCLVVAFSILSLPLSFLIAPG